ncbi:hypothetical protein BU16DRAFT_531945 [Lophium mytilinum]|uniref:DUF7704 domain-containing protein n=1 Tax=Lophium mytilinum TaxID=390894 RepID=A0A6A6QBS1_9PEZI|nr:hypothetical protein BU16DRAFT_531945 [Lophium mytilinum]
MASKIPTFPRTVFTIIEPLSTAAGYLGPLLSPASFVSSQSPFEPPHQLYLTEHVLALQLGNCYGLLALLGLFILNTTDELKTVKAYLLALWIADIGHIVVTLWGLGVDGWSVSSWNGMAWGNVGFTAFLFAVRSIYFLGLFGDDEDEEKVEKVKKV